MLSTPQQLTVAPFLPFQQEDLQSILRSRIQHLDTKYRGLQWKRLHISNNGLEYFLSTDHVEYFDLVSEEDYDLMTLTFSLRGANVLEDNALVQGLHSKLISGTRRRPYKVASLDINNLDDSRWETVFTWCNEDRNGVLEECKEEWRSAL